MKSVSTRWTRRVAVLPAVLLFICACGSATPNSTTTTFKGTKKVGLSTSLTGAVSSYGIAGQNGLQMAIDDINGKTGVNGYKIELDAADDAAQAAKGSENAKRLIVEDSVVALFGAVSSGVCLAESTGFDDARLLAHSHDMLQETLCRRRRDDRSHIGLKIGRIADDQFVHRARDHFQHLIGDIILQEQ